jgi:phage host-nuclease inhibitor protein Gam
MARFKPNVKKIESLEDANLTLREIGLLERELESIDGSAHKQIAEIKTAAVKTGEPVRKRIADLSALPGAYAEYNSAELFRDKKTVQVSFGIFGYRKSTSISVRKTTLNLLEKLGLEKQQR